MNTPKKPKRPQNTIERIDSWDDIAESSSSNKEEQPSVGTVRSKPKKPPPFIPKVQVPPPKKEAAARIKGLRLLIVDDDPTRIEELAAALSRFGALVSIGDTMENGFNQATQLMPDAIISDLASPGEKGWELVQRLRRHTVLRWTPVLLLRWWKQTSDGGEQILLSRVLDRLEETLAPLRVIEDRIVANRPLSERIDMTGPAALLRLLSSAGLSGLLTVNDAWSVFEVQLKGGRLNSVVRSGVDGGTDKGNEAFLQLLLCDSGRWSFRSQTSIKTIANITADVERALNQTSHTLSLLFDSETSADNRSVDRLEIRLDILAQVGPTMSTSQGRIAEALTNGLAESELDLFFTEEDGLFKVERAIKALVRCGAIRPRKKLPKKERDKKEVEAAHTVAYLLNSLAKGIADITGAIETDIPLGQSSSESDAMPPTVPLQADFMEQGDLYTPHMPSESVNDEQDQSASGIPTIYTEGPSDTSVLKPDGDLLDKMERQDWDGAVPGDSAAPPSGETKQKWVAIVLAVLLVGILFAGLFFIGSGSDKKPEKEIFDSQETPH